MVGSMKRKWNDKKVLILGLSKSGISAAKYLSSRGADCYITEFKPNDDKELIESLEKEGIKHSRNRRSRACLLRIKFTIYCHNGNKRQNNNHIFNITHTIKRIQCACMRKYRSSPYIFNRQKSGLPCM